MIAGTNGSGKTTILRYLPGACATTLAGCKNEKTSSFRTPKKPWQGSLEPIFPSGSEVVNIDTSGIDRHGNPIKPVDTQTPIENFSLLGFAGLDTKSAEDFGTSFIDRYIDESVDAREKNDINYESRTLSAIRQAARIIDGVSGIKVTKSRGKRTVCVEKDGKLVCRVCGGELSARPDDQDTDAINKRHDIYYDEVTGTMAAVNYFKNAGGAKVISVDGSVSIKEVTDAIMKELV